ncbi:MAG: hypothetical protein LQ338_006875 [Usnochroma carphineum]|nr:MAG: hypothetical protein LQ338_006875 [Usnochroma carphineum]
MPSQSFRKYIRYSRKIGFVLVTLLAPEFGVFVAFRQYHRAKTLIKELSKLKAQAAQTRKGLFIDVSDADIEDKSKANLLAKGLVLVQITWTMLQCLSRKIAGLPISLLEVHTLVHAGCALIMYCLWFKKPMDVEEPIVVSTADYEPEIALMLVRSRFSGLQPFGNFFRSDEFRSARYAGATYRDWPGHQASEASYLVFDPSWEEKVDSSSDTTDYSLTLIPRQEVSSGMCETDLGTNRCCSCSRHSTASRDCKLLLVGTDPTGALSDRTSPNRRPTNKHDVNTMTHSGYRGTRVFKSVAPLVYEHHQVTYQYNSSRLVDSISTESGASKSFNVWQGDIARGGIGPNAFAVGYWTGGPGQQEHPTKVLEIPEDVRKRLPFDEIDQSSVKFNCPLKISLSQKDLRRWELAGTALRAEYSFPSADDGNRNRLINFSGPEGSFDSVYLNLRTVNWWTHGISAVNSADRAKGAMFFLILYHQFAKSIGRAWTFPVIGVVGTAFLYAALHMALWDYSFPTVAEKLLWRVSSSTLLAVPTLVSAFLVSSATYEWLGSKIAQGHRNKADPPQGNSGASDGPIPCTIKETNVPDPTLTYPTDKEVMLMLVATSTLWIVSALYILSRVFIIVESFISLRHVPIGVYASVGWSKYIPHL